MIYLAKLRLDQLGPFEQREVEFGPGLNIVVGPNEAGKSTIAWTILAVLVGDAEAERRHHRPHQGSFGAAVRLETDAESWIVDRDFASHEVKISQVRDGRAEEKFRAVVSPKGRSANVQAFRQIIGSLFALPDPQLLPPLLGGNLERVLPAEAAERIRQILSGRLLHDHAQVAKSLQDKYFALTKVNPAGRKRVKNGRLENVEERIAEARRMLEQAHRSAEEWRKAEQGFTAAAQRLAAIENEMRAANQKIDRLGALLELDEKLDTLREKARNLDVDQQRWRDLEARENECRRELQAHAAVDSLTAGQIQNLRRKRSLLASAAEREEKRRELTDQTQLQSAGDLAWKLIATGLAAALGAAGIFLLPSWRPTVAAVSGLFVLVFLGLALRTWLGRLTAGKILQARLADLAADRDQALAEAGNLAIGAGFDHLHLGELEDVLRRLEIVQQLRHQLETLASQKEILPSAENLAEAQKRLRAEEERLQDEKKSRQAAPPAIAAYDTDQLGALVARLTALESAQEKARTERDEALAWLAQCQGRLDNPTAWEEALQDYEAEREYLKQESEALWLALETLDRARDEFMGEDLIRLAATTQRLFDLLVADNRRRVAVDQNLSPLLTDREATFDLDLLSRATGDQLLLCCRLALLDHLTGDRRAPLWLDDAAVGYDRERRARLLELLARIADERQIILFTPDEALVAAAGDRARVIALP
ncbi:MAG: AAA family ATPase [Myxococcales bacterium]|nr:AAA family ATPase [Myxococcales bacterium]